MEFMQISLLLLLAAVQLHLAQGIAAGIPRDRIISGRDRVTARDIRHEVSSMCVSVVKQPAGSTPYDNNTTKIMLTCSTKLPYNYCNRSIVSRVCIEPAGDQVSF